jgi:hypothetical protein
MDALDLVLTAVIAVVSTAFALVLLARLDDMRTVRRLRAELEAARGRIAELSYGQGVERRQPEPAGRFSRR